MSGRVSDSAILALFVAVIEIQFIRLIKPISVTGFYQVFIINPVKIIRSEYSMTRNATSFTVSQKRRCQKVEGRGFETHNGRCF